MRKNYLRRMLAGMTAVIISCCVIPASTAIAVNADNTSYCDEITETDISLAMQTSIPRMLWVMENKPEYLGFEVPNGTIIGDKFTIADVQDGVLVDDNSIVYYPVSVNGEIVAIVSLIKSEGEVTTTIGKDFSYELNAALKQSSNVTLVSVNDSNIAAVTENGNISILSTNGTMSSKIISDFIGNAVIAEADADDSYTITSAEVYDTNRLTEDVINLYSDNTERIRKDYYINDSNVPSEVLSRGSNGSVNTNSISIHSENILYSYDPYAIGLGDYLDEYEIVGQGSYSICWAATIASMLRWEMPSIYSGYTAINVCDALNHSYDATPASNVDDYLTYFLTTYNDNYWPIYEENAYSQSSICTIINNEDPAYMSSAGASSSSGRHATALCGYLFFSDDTFAIRVMNPGYNSGAGTFQLSDRAYSSTTFRYPYNSTYYTWDRSVRLYYHHS